MKKLLFTFFILPILNIYAAEPDSTQFNCGFDMFLDSQMLDPEFAAFQKRMDFYIQKHIQQGLFVPQFPKPMPQDIELFTNNCDSCFGNQSLYLIPVVVHIVHRPSDSVIGTGSNISNAQVYNSILELNKSFAAYGYTDTNK
jgi:hypothetical protein